MISEWFDLNQLFILLFSGSGVFFLGFPKSGMRKIGALCAMASEPFWLWGSYQDSNGGIFILCTIFFFGYLRVYLNNTWSFSHDRYTS